MNERNSRLRALPVFVSGAVQDWRTVGSVIPSSPALARALAEAIDHLPRPRRILEVGAGTGPVSWALAKRLSEGEELVMLEPMTRFHEPLQHVAALATSRGAAASILDTRLENLKIEVPFDAVVASLPFAAFEPEEVQVQADAVRRALRVGGVFSYYTYFWWTTWAATQLGYQGRRMHRNFEILKGVAGDRANLHDRLVLWNVWPAHVYSMPLPG